MEFLWSCPCSLSPISTWRIIQLVATLFVLMQSDQPDVLCWLKDFQVSIGKSYRGCQYGANVMVWVLCVDSNWILEFILHWIISAWRWIDRPSRWIWDCCNMKSECEDEINPSDDVKGLNGNRQMNLYSRSMSRWSCMMMCERWFCSACSPSYLKSLHKLWTNTTQLADFYLYE